MKRRELVVSVVLALILAVGIIVVLNGTSTFRLGRSTEAIGAGVDAYTSEPLMDPMAPSPDATSTSIPIDAQPAATPTLIPLNVGSEKEDDLEDVLLLYDSNHGTNFDINFCKIAEYYGLLCKKVALNATNLTDELLQDGQGDYFKLVGISAGTLLGYPSLLTNDELAISKSSIETGGVNLLVSKMNTELAPPLFWLS